jgi:tetratricopeptide (TPR) repeat protein
MSIESNRYLFRTAVIASHVNPCITQARDDLSLNVHFINSNPELPHCPLHQEQIARIAQEVLAIFQEAARIAEAYKQNWVITQQQNRIHFPWVKEEVIQSFPIKIVSHLPNTNFRNVQVNFDVEMDRHKRVTHNQAKGQTWKDTIPGTIESVRDKFPHIMRLFHDVYTKCIDEHHHPGSYYQRACIRLQQAKIHFRWNTDSRDETLFQRAVEDMQEVIKADSMALFIADIDSQGSSLSGVTAQAYFELGRLDKARQELTRIEEYTPGRAYPYLYQALVDFEKGDFDQAVKAYSEWKELKSTPYLEEDAAPGDFKQALLASLKEGASDSVKDFFPSMLSTVRGLGTALWCFAQHPVDETINFTNACYELSQNVGKFIKTLDWDKIEGLRDDLKEMYRRYDSLSEEEKGKLIGYTIGRYGTDILAPGAIVKAASAIRKVRAANRLCNLEALATPANKESIIAASARHVEGRKRFCQNVKLELDKQNKHNPLAHNYEEGRSIFLEENPQSLILQFAGKGEALGGRNPGGLDYRERVNFGKFIGYHVNRFTKVKTPTTWGEIRYSKKGAHIVPSYPPNLE